VSSLTASEGLKGNPHSMPDLRSTKYTHFSEPLFGNTLDSAPSTAGKGRTKAPYTYRKDEEVISNICHYKTVDGVMCILILLDNGVSFVTRLLYFLYDSCLFPV